MLRTLTLVFALLMAADGALTYSILKDGGRELNKSLAWLMEKIGVVPALLIAKIVPVAAVWYAIYVDQMPWELLAAVCAGYTWVVWHNWKEIKRG